MASHLPASNDSDSSSKSSASLETRSPIPPNVPPRTNNDNELTIQELFENQKAKFQKLYELFMEDAKSGDAVYIFPRKWFSTFFKTESITKDDDSVSNVLNA